MAPDKAQLFWKPAEAGLKARYGVLKGGGLLRTLRVVTSTLPDSSQAVERLLQRAMFDPDITSYLLTRKVRDLDYEASDKWIRRALAGAEYARKSADEDASDESQSR